MGGRQPTKFQKQKQIRLLKSLSSLLMNFDGRPYFSEEQLVRRFGQKKFHDLKEDGMLLETEKGFVANRLALRRTVIEIRQEYGIQDSIIGEGFGGGVE